MTGPVLVHTQTAGRLFCERVKEYLSQKGTPYIERDVLTDPKAVVVSHPPLR